jgi:hypothetical protein
MPALTAQDPPFQANPGKRPLTRPAPSKSAQQNLARSAARRSVMLEGLLCAAIRRRVLLQLSYGDDPAERLFEPTVLYLAPSGKLHLRGHFVGASASVPDTDRPHDLAVDKLSSVTLTEDNLSFVREINRFDALYAKGIICATGQPLQPRPSSARKSRRNEI